MGKLSSLGDTDQALSTDTLNEILTLHAEELRIAKERYEVDKASGASDPNRKGIGGFEAHRRLVNQMNHQMVLQKRNLEEAVEKLKEQNKQLVAVQNKLQAKLNENTALEDKLLQFDEIEKKAENQKYLKALRELVALNESLKLQEAQFKAHCKKQMAEMKEKIEQIRQGTAPAGTSEEGEDIDERERIKLIEETYEKTAAKLQKARAIMAKKNRDIAIIKRKIDEVPTRIELTQYQRRFVELYEQVGGKYEETRKYFTNYNVLEDTKQFLSKEVLLLNNINESFNSVISTKQSKDKFVENLDKTLNGVKQNLTLMETKVETVKTQRDKLNQKYMQMVEQQRTYYKLVKEFQDECKKFEELSK